ncbi:MAG TPA: hypothetical protein VN706_25030 [Gemmatimonadaceae bacterium]|nr:hypothetical protein [Gemmatimonadaceae bacterium]
MTDAELALCDRYMPLITAEYLRIGFTEDDFRYLGSGGALTEERFEEALRDLRSTPSGIGAQGYYARHGMDFAAMKAEVAARIAREG